MFGLKQSLMYLIAGTRGGSTRVRILKLLEKKPLNPNQLSKEMKMDYKTMIHHLKVLEDNHLIMPLKKGKYGSGYLLSPELEQNIRLIDEIWERFGKE